MDVAGVGVDMAGGRGGPWMWLGVGVDMAGVGVDRGCGLG